MKGNLTMTQIFLILLLAILILAVYVRNNPGTSGNTVKEKSPNYFQYAECFRVCKNNMNAHVLSGRADYDDRDIDKICDKECE